MDILCGGIPSLVFRTESRSFEPMRLLFEIKRELSLGTVCQNYQFIVEQLKLIAGLNGQPTNRFAIFVKNVKILMNRIQGFPIMVKVAGLFHFRWRKSGNLFKLCRQMRYTAIAHTVGNLT
jgi:hypothetical protein